MTRRHIPLTMQDWETSLNNFIKMFEYGLLKDAGKESIEIAKLHAETEFEKYRIVQDRSFMSDYDKFLLNLEKGEIYTKYKNFMGYTCVDGEIVIVPGQAKIVRKIFDLYLQGQSLGQIKAYLEAKEIRTVTSKETWDAKTIQRMLTNEKYKGDTMLQKTFTENFMTGKKSKNIGQRNKYYVRDSHPAIISAEVFDMVQGEMAKRSRVIRNEDGTVEISGSKYNGKYILGNFVVCGDCGASYRRRTEIGKVVWRCAVRIEKGKEECSHSPTLDESWIQDTLSEVICRSGAYDEGIIRNEVDKIQVHDTYIMISRTDGLQEKQPFQDDCFCDIPIIVNKSGG